jgi:hypothetical protein
VIKETGSNPPVKKTATTHKAGNAH